MGDFKESSSLHIETMSPGSLSPFLKKIRYQDFVFDRHD